MKKNEVVAISGVNGFLGKNLAGILVERGLKVAGIPREILTMPDGLQDIMEEIQPDYVIHLAAYGNHSHHSDYIDEIFATNVIKTYNLLRATANVDYKAFINVSSSSVYGTKPVAMKENMILEPTTLYACTKAAGEDLALMYNRVLRKPIISVRPFSVYGPGEAEFRFIPKVIECMVKGKSLDLVKEPVHDWIYIEDFIEGIFTCIDNVDKLTGQTVNIGTGRQHTNEEIVDILLTMKSEPAFPINVVEGVRDFDTDNWRANVTKLKSFGWKPKFPLKRGLKETFKFYEELYSMDEPVEDVDVVAQSVADMGVEFKDSDKELDLFKKGVESDNIVMPGSAS